jgi:hypothetical protein
MGPLPIWVAARQCLFMAINGGGLTCGVLRGWKTFLCYHVGGIASLYLFVVRTVSFKLIYCLVVLRHARRRLVTIGATSDTPPSGSLVR